MDKNVQAELEAHVLGGVMKDNSTFHGVADLVSLADFTDPKNQKIYSAIHSLGFQGLPCDAVSVGDFLESQGTESAIAYVVTLVRNTVGTQNVLGFARKLKERSDKRSAIKACLDAHDEIINGGDAQSILQKALLGMQASNKTPYMAYGDVLREAFSSIQEAAAKRKEDGLVGISWGLDELDKMTGGIRDPRLWVLAARPSMGKTALALQVRLQAAKSGFSVGAIEAEMDYDEIGQRSMAHQYSVPFTALSKGNTDALARTSDKMKAEASSGVKRLQDYPIYSDANTWTIPGIVARATEWKRKYDIQLLTIDHMHCLKKTDPRQSELDFYNDAARSFKLLAKELKIPVLLLAQMNRSIEKENRQPRLSDIRGSGGIEEHADCALFLWGDRNTLVDGTRSVKITIDKGRMMQIGTLPDIFIFDGVHQQFKQVDMYAEGYS